MDGLVDWLLHSLQGLLKRLFLDGLLSNRCVVCYATDLSDRVTAWQSLWLAMSPISNSIQTFFFAHFLHSSNIISCVHKITRDDKNYTNLECLFSSTYPAIPSSLVEITVTSWEKVGLSPGSSSQHSLIMSNLYNSKEKFKTVEPPHKGH